MPSKNSLTFWKKKKPRPQDAQPASDTEEQELAHGAVEQKAPYQKGHIGLVLLNPNGPESNAGAPAERYNLDIVAVHGITGDAFKTWTYPKGANTSTGKDKERGRENGKHAANEIDEEQVGGTNWLRDFLPNSFPGARIFSFGYPAGVFWTKGTGNFDSFARSLLEELKRVRVQSKDRSRRIILICHSMGGIVVKKALIVARLDSEYDEIRNSVSAILFLSTPHRGSALVPLATLLTRLASVANLPVSIFTGKIRTDLVQGLGKDSDPLTEITKNFRNQMANIKIASFIEKEITRPLTTVIVDESSGIMGSLQERIVPMHGCDHRTICRFEAETSSGYKSILGVLQDWADEAKEKANVLTSEDISCLKSLAFLEMNFRRSDADKAHPNTCGWILEHKSYIDWLSNQRGLLWIKGKPGAGKSTLLAFIYRVFQESKLDQAGLSLEFFFHGRGTAFQKTSIGMFRSLLHQLYARDSSIRKPILNTFREKEVFGEAGQDWQWQLRELKDLFFNAILTAAKSRKIVVFIDALDEAGPHARDLVDFFHEMNDHMNEKNNTAAICISCRHYPVTAVIPGLDVLVENNNHHDIAHYVHAKLQINTEKDEKDRAGEWTKIERQIVKNANGVFQWARLVVPMVLEQYEEGYSWHDIRKMLARVPQELGDVYEHILNNIIKPERRKKTLHLMQWIFLAEQPLGLDELSLAMAFDDVYISSRLQSFEETLSCAETNHRMQKLVNSLSGGLAEIKAHDKDDILSSRHNIVQFIHQSVNDFLLSKGLELLFSQTTEVRNDQVARELTKLSNDEIIGQSQDRLSRSCINYLRLAQIDWSKVMEHHGGNTFGLPFIKYAVKFWLTHAQKAERYGISQDHLVEWFNPEEQLLEKWIKIYNTIGGSGSDKPTEGITLLHLASASDFKKAAQILLQQGMSVQSKDTLGETALHYAARWGHQDIVETLLRANALPGEKNKMGITPIERAAANGHGKIVQLLLKSGADIDNALQAAAYAGSANLVKFLLGEGADINACGGEFGTALEAAVQQNHEAVARLLLQCGAKVNMQGGDFGTALRAAAHYGYENIVQLLLEHGADVNLRRDLCGSPLEAAIRGGNRLIVDAMLDRGADVNAPGGPFGTPLVAAALKGDLNLVQLLIERGAVVNPPSQAYGDALQKACCYGQIHIAKFLLQSGAEVNAPGGDNGNALQLAAGNGRVEIIELLLQNGAVINAQSKNFGTALQAAAANRKNEAVECLLDNGADVEIQGGVYGNALQAAAAAGVSFMKRPITQILLERGADVNAQGGKYPNALQAAVFEGDIDIVTILLKHGAIFDPQDPEFSASLSAADGDSEISAILATRGIKAKQHIEYLIG